MLGGSSDDQEPQPALDGFTESDIRAGGPRLCEMPCFSDYRIPSTHTMHKELADDGARNAQFEALKICVKEGLNRPEAHFCLRRPTFNPESAGVPTLLIVTRRANHRSRGWISVARKLQQHLHSVGITQVSIEIMDPPSFRNPKIFPVSSSHPIFKLWKSVTDTIIRDVDLKGISNINCFKIGPRTWDYECPQADKGPVTILMGVDWHVRRYWKNVREGILAILSRFGLDDVGVMIRKDRGLSRRAGGDDSHILVRDQCTKYVDMGYSLSPRKMLESQGTFGGWIQLRNPQTGAWEDLGITCCHCVFPKIEDVSGAERDAIRNWTKKGVGIHDANRVEYLSLDSPSKGILNAGLADLDRRIRGLREDECFSKVEKARARGDFVVPRDKEKWELHSKLITILEQQRKWVDLFLQKRYYHLGEVFCASGLQKVPMNGQPDLLQIRDWALIRISKDRKIGSNKIPRHVPAHYFSKLPPVTRSMPGNGAELSKIGQATGFTVGRYHALTSVHIAERMENGKKVRVVTHEHCFTISDQSGYWLVASADSGSLVYETITSFVVGMLFGGSETHDVGYFTPIDDLFEHIQKVTGAEEVRLQE